MRPEHKRAAAYLTIKGQLAAARTARSPGARLPSSRRAPLRATVRRQQAEEGNEKMPMASSGREPWLQIVEEAAHGVWGDDVVVSVGADAWQFHLRTPLVSHLLTIEPSFLAVETFAGLRFWALGQAMRSVSELDRGDRDADRHRRAAPRHAAVWRVTSAWRARR